MIRFYNGRVLSFSGGLKISDAEVWTDGGVITHFGAANEDMPAFEREIDLKGDLLIPGFKDAHTHTVMSGHAWSTIQENCAAAAQKGMKALCMTDHGFCMKGTGTIWTPWSFSQLPDVIGGIRVYPGMEFNLWDTEGHLDEYLPGAFQHIRFGIASMHKNVMPVLDADAHTEAYIRAMDHACIDLIGHPGIPSYPIDAERLVRAVAERGRLIEINNNSFVARPGCDVNCRKIARLCMQYDVRVCVDSDAHFCANVGEVPKALEMLDSIDFPPELIVNSTFERFEAYIAEREARMKTASVL